MFFFIFLLCHWNFLPLKVISRLFSSFFVVVSALYRLPKNLPYVCGYMGASCFKNLVGMRWCLYLAGIWGQQMFLKTQKSGFSFKEKKKKRKRSDDLVSQTVSVLFLLSKAFFITSICYYYFTVSKLSVNRSFFSPSPL